MSGYDGFPEVGVLPRIWFGGNGIQSCRNNAEIKRMRHC